MLVPIFSPDPQRTLTEAELFALPMNWMTAACMEGRFRRLTGWQGLVPTASRARAFTCRIKSRPGIFGLMPMEAQAGELGIADFHLFYFPALDDPVIEQIALAAAISVASPEALEKIRDFPAHTEFAALFAIADMRLALTQPGRAFGLSLHAPTRRQIRTEKGVAAPEGGWLVSPGGFEEDLPALALARDVFGVLATGFAAATGKPPERWLMAEAPASLWIRGSDGQMKKTEAPEEQERTEVLLWEKAARGAWPEAQKPLDPELYRQVCVAAGAEAPSETEAIILKRPRLVVLSGFLGSGKTSFLNQFIEFHLAHDQLVAVIQNELGETGVDSHLLEGDDSVLTFDAGCVCCTLAGSLSRGIQQLNEKLSPEIIVLETTGLANPMNMLDELHEIADLAELSSVVAVVDASRFYETLAVSEVAAEQIRAADTIILNKCDLVSEEERAAVEAEIRRRNPDALFVSATQGRVNPAVFAEGLSRHAKPDVDLSRKGENCCEKHHHHHHHHRHGASSGGVTHLDEGFSALRFDLAPQVNREQLIDLLTLSPPGVMRIKGLAHFEGEDEPEIVQYVPGQAACEPMAKASEETSFLLIIGRNLDAAALKDLWRPLLKDKDA